MPAKKRPLIAPDAVIEPAPAVPAVPADLANRMTGLAVGAVLVTGGVHVSHPAILGLLFFGMGILTLGYYFGKSE